MRMQTNALADQSSISHGKLERLLHIMKICLRKIPSGYFHLQSKTRFCVKLITLNNSQFKVLEK